jgi:hypothetical protein
MCQGIPKVSYALERANIPFIDCFHCAEPVKARVNGAFVSCENFRGVLGVCYGACWTDPLEKKDRIRSTIEVLSTSKPAMYIDVLTKRLRVASGFRNSFHDVVTSGSTLLYLFSTP